MKLYCSRTKHGDAQGHFRDVAPLKSLMAVNILHDIPKFRGIHEKESEHIPEDSDMSVNGSINAHSRIVEKSPAKKKHIALQKTRKILLETLRFQRKSKNQ